MNQRNTVGKRAVDLAKTVWVPLKKMAYNWKYDGYPGDSFVVFELFGRSNETTLRLTHHVLESFPEDIPEFTRENCIEGWTFFIQKI